jgi:transposase
MYKWQHLLENFFCKNKKFRRIATRYEKTEKTDVNHMGMVYAVSTMIALR